MDKQHILAEIKRTADANAGSPLGRERFFRETGIKETDWSGIYWARWSDAVREAGYSSNQLQTAFEDDYLLERYAALVRELGRVPVISEMKLKRRTDSAFPSHNTFARLGTKQQLLAKVAKFCRMRSDLDDIAEICEMRAIKPLEEQVEKVDTASENFGFVYLIQSGRFYKVGRTNALGRREYELAIQLPVKTRTVHAIRTDDPLGIEAYWHKRFAGRRMNGEWFELTRTDVSAFKRRKFM